MEKIKEIHEWAKSEIERKFTIIAIPTFGFSLAIAFAILGIIAGSNVLFKVLDTIAIVVGVLGIWWCKTTFVKEANAILRRVWNNTYIVVHQERGNHIPRID